MKFGRIKININWKILKVIVFDNLKSKTTLKANSKIVTTYSKPKFVQF